MRMKAPLGLAASLVLTLGTGAAHAQTLQPNEITDAAAAHAIDAAKAKAHELGAFVCIAVVDSAGDLKAFDHMEGAAPGCAESAIAKARAAARFRIVTESMMERVNKGEPALIALPGMTPLGGGVPVKTADGIWHGAVGSAGAVASKEATIAGAGAQALTEALSK